MLCQNILGEDELLPSLVYAEDLLSGARRNVMRR